MSGSCIKSYKTDSKVNYEKTNNSQPLNPTQILPKFFTHLEEAENYMYSQDFRSTNNRKASTEMPFKDQLAKLGDIKASPKSFILLVTLIILGVGIALFEITVELGPDEDCWEEFKSNSCDFTNPTSPKCITLLKCISGGSWQLNLFYLLGLALTGWGAFRFRRQLRSLSIKGLGLWEKFLENK
jgi:hypothetical protein